jgi:osmotically-inducible protein OsmY
MKTIFSTLLVSALATAVSGAYAHTDDTDHANKYKVTSQAALADHQRALKQCKELSGAAENVCIEQAKVAHAQAAQDTTVRYNNTLEARTAARTALAKAEYALARARCATMTGADEEKCMSRALAARTDALADAKADRAIRVAAVVDNKGMVANTTTREPAKAAAVEQCAQIDGKPSTGCLIDNKPATGPVESLAQKTENAAERAAAKTAAATRSAATQTEQAAETTMAKADRMAQTAAAKTERAYDKAAAKTERAYDKAAAKTERATENLAARTDNALDKSEGKTERAASKTGQVVADSVITTKLKAGLLAEPDLSGLSIHVETEKGVVMLSGFVESKENAEQAVRMAHKVDGVTKVRSSLLVK